MDNSGQNESKPALWILHDSRFAVSSASKSFDLAERFSGGGYEISHFTRAEVELELAFSVLRFEAEKAPAILDEQEAELLLFKLIGLNKDSFPTLWQELSASRFRDRALPLSLPVLRSCLDNARIFERKEKIFLNAVEEESFEEAGAIKAEELLRLSDFYENLMEETGSWDRAGALSSLSEKLGKERFAQFLKDEVLPPLIVLNSPATILPLEESIWSRVSQLTRLVLLRAERVDEDLALKPEEEHLLYPDSGVRNLAAFSRVEEVLLEPVSPAVAKMGNESAQNVELNMGQVNLDLRLGKAKNRKEEVATVLGEIKGSIDQGQGSAQDYQVILLDKEPYLELLEKEAAKQGLALNNCSGASIERTRAGSSFHSWLDWLEKGSVKSLAELYSKPLLKERLAQPKEFANLKKLYPSEIKRIETGFDYSSASEGTGLEQLVLSQEFRFEELFESLRQLNSSWVFRFSLSYVEAKEFVGVVLEKLAGMTVRSVSGAENYLPSLLGQLAAFLSEVEKRENLKEEKSWSELLKKVRSEFYQLRKRVLKKRPREKNQSDAEYEGELRQAQAFRTILCSERELRKLEHVIYEFEENLLPQLTDAWKRKLSNLRFAAENEPNAISVTGFLDIRGSRNKRCYLAGFENSLFPGSRDGLFATSQLEMAKRAVDRPWPASADWYRLFSLLLYSCKSLFITVPETGEGKELSPAVPFLKFAEFIAVERLGAERLSSAGLEAQTKQLKDNKTLELLRSRKSQEFTAFDGQLSPSESLSTLLARRGVVSEQGKHIYSPTLLELYAGCPQTFLFSEVLGLRPFENPFQFRSALETGNLLHACLENVFSKYGKLDNFPSSVEDLSEFEPLPNCGQLIKEAREEFEALVSPSSLGLESGLELERANQLEKLAEGLSSEEGSGRRGLIKAALVYSSQLFESACLAAELEFGRGTRTPAKLPGTNDSEILIRGKIDRIDRLADGRLLVIDYKTGREKSFSEVKKGKILQTALYATWLLQNIAGLKAEQVRGGMLQLNKPNRRGDDIASVTEGVFNEQLAIKKQGVRYAIDFSGVEENVKLASAFVAEYDQRIFSGDYRYSDDQADLGLRGFSRISYRNPTKLVEDKESLEELANWEWVPPVAEPVKFQAEGQDNSSPGVPMLTAEQSEATDPNNSIVLRASAGSGKTRVLQSRYIRLLLDGVLVEEIVAITFTEKAAREIQSRVESKVQQVLALGNFEGKTLLEEERERLSLALNELNKSRIGTIHSFARSIIGSDSVLSAGAGEFDLPGGEELRELAESCFQQMLLDDENSELARSVLRSGMSWVNFKETVLSLMLRRRTLEDCQSILELEQGDESSLPETYKNSLEEAFAEHCDELRPELEKSLKLLLTGAMQCLADKIGAKKPPEPEKINDWELLLASIESFLVNIKSASSGTAASEYHQVRGILEEKKSAAFRKTKDHPNYWKQFEEVFKAPENTIFSYNLAQEAENFKIAKAILTLASRGLKVFVAEKKVRRTIDFDDLIHLANWMLKVEEGDSEKIEERKQKLQLKLKEKIRAIMVDEFQDTDRVQWELITGLIGENTSLFVVGDSQQAIYGFRGGDSGVFESALSVIKAKGGKELSLTKNFRSHSSVVEFVNEVFPKLFDVDYFRTGEPRVKGATRSWPMVSPSNGQAEQRVFLAFDEYKKSRANEAMAVALRVREILDSVQNKEGKWEKLENREGNLIALLARKGNDLLALGRALELLNVPYQISRSGVFYDLEEVVQFENLLKVLIDPRDKIALTGVLRAPLYGLSDQELLEFFTGNYSAAEEILEELEKFRRLARSLSASQLIEEVIEVRGLMESYAQADLQGSIANIEGFISVIRAEELSGSCDGSLRSALETLLQKIADGEKPPEIDTASCPVVLSTVHGSKGLEYPMVILAMLEQDRSGINDFIVEESSLGSSRVPLVGVRVEDPDKEYRRSKTLSGFLAEQQSKQLAASEAKRLFYVACTRAEEYLIIALRKEKKEKEQPSDLSKAIRASQSPAGWLGMIAKRKDNGWVFGSGQHGAVEVPLT